MEAADRAAPVRLQNEAEQHGHGPMKIVTIQEAGLGGFWLRRVLEAERIESSVVMRRRLRPTFAGGRRRIVEAPLRSLMAWAWERGGCVRRPSSSEGRTPGR